MTQDLMQVYTSLQGRHRAQAEPHVWWPLTHHTDPPEWVRVVHAALSVNSRWALIVKGTNSLARHNLLQAVAIARVSVASLVSIIEGGLPEPKAQRLRQICELAVQFGSEVHFLHQVQREDLLSLPWVRDETADRILLYACGRPIFPVDRHVKKLFRTSGFVSAQQKDEAIKMLVRAALGEEVASYQRLYALCQLESAHLR